MIIKARVIPNSRKESVERIGEGRYRVKVREKPLEGRANAAVIKALAQYFKTGESDISIIRGAASRDKTVGIVEAPR